MKVELKRLVTYPRMSEETTAFNADLWIDGKKVGTAENDGHGGSNLLRFDDRKVEQAFYAWAKTLPPEKSSFGGGDLAMDGDFYISLLVGKYEEEKQYARWCKTKTVFRLKGDKAGEWRTLARLYSPAAKEWVVKTYGDKVEEILNERFGGMMGDNAAEEIRLRKLCAKKAVIHLKGDPAGNYRTYKVPYTAEFKARVMASPMGAKIDEWLNERFLPKG